MAVILGIDPGSHATGFGLISSNDKIGSLITHIDHGAICPPKKIEFSERLNFIYHQVKALFIKHQPHFCVIEKAFLGKNVDSAFKLGHVRGLAMQLAVEHNCKVMEFAARFVKKQITGNGNADKEQVRWLTLSQLNISSDSQYDATDALALALTGHRQIEISNQLSSREIST